MLHSLSAFHRRSSDRSEVLQHDRSKTDGGLRHSFTDIGYPQTTPDLDSWIDSIYSHTSALDRPLLAGHTRLTFVLNTNLYTMHGWIIIDRMSTRPLYILLHADSEVSLEWSTH